MMNVEGVNLKELFDAKTFAHILRCLLNLTQSEVEVYFALHEHPNKSVDELAEVMGKDRSGVYRSLQNLLEKGLVSREYRILRHGGYKYLYVPVPIDDLKFRLKEELNKWFHVLNEVVEGFTIEFGKVKES